ncbi:dnaJ homolog subfamily C member 3-like isoform X2 [Branchiostoma floridae x Branchiostoma belcheri]
MCSCAKMAWEMVGVYRLLSSIPLFVIIVNLQYEVSEGGANPQEIDQHLKLGTQLLSAGQLADALSHFHAAIEGDPDNYLTYFRRATVYLAMGKSRQALPDLSKVIHLKPDFTQARVQRANVYLKQGKLNDAEEDYMEVLRVNPSNEDAKTQLQFIEPIRETISQTDEMMTQGRWNEAIELLTAAIEKCVWDPSLREKRAQCYMEIGEHFKAINDIKPTTKMRPDNTEAYFRVSKMYYDVGELEDSLTEVRECLKLDPDHKSCFPHYKHAKKLNKLYESAQNFINEGRYKEAIVKLEAALESESQIWALVLKAKSKICRCYSKLKDVPHAIKNCGEVLEMDEHNIEALVDRAETYIMAEEFERAVEDYQKAHDIDNNLRHVAEGLERAKRLLKQSQKRDYYKILGVKRNARKREIEKAYRKLAAEWHPDNFRTEEEKKIAEKKFIEIAAAREVLADPEKRQKFDNGEDPLDPEQQRHGHNPWGHQGFHFNPFGPGGGNGFNFKFHFN